MRFEHGPRCGPVYLGLWLAADTLRAYMQAQGLTRERLAERCGIAANTLTCLLDRQRATARTIKQVSEATGLTLPTSHRGHLFAVMDLTERGDGWEYEIAGVGPPLKGWRRGRRTEVEAYAKKVAKAASDRITQGRIF